jgi:hypothetical protein
MLLAELSGSRARSDCRERLLGQALAVVEIAGDAEGAHVVAEAFQPVRLARRDAAVGIQDHHVEAGRRWNAAPDRGAGIARGGDENSRRRRAGIAQARQRFGEEARGVILERGGGSMEQLEDLIIRRRQSVQRRGTAKAASHSAGSDARRSDCRK